MATIIFNDHKRLSISGHLMNQFCRFTQQRTKDELFINELEEFKETGEISLHYLAADKCMDFLNGVEDALNFYRNQEGYMSNMVRGGEAIVSSVRGMVQEKWQ